MGKQTAEFRSIALADASTRPHFVRQRVQASAILYYAILTVANRFYVSCFPPQNQRLHYFRMTFERVFLAARAPMAGKSRENAKNLVLLVGFQAEPLLYPNNHGKQGTGQQSSGRLPPHPPADKGAEKGVPKPGAKPEAPGKRASAACLQASRSSGLTKVSNCAGSVPIFAVSLALAPGAGRRALVRRAGGAMG